METGKFHLGSDGGGGKFHLSSDGGGGKFHLSSDGGGGKFHLSSDGGGGHVVRKIFTALSQLVIVLLVWEFLRTSIETTDNGEDDFVVHLNKKSVNLLECFPSTYQGGNLDFDSIISRNKTNNSSKQHRFLSVDIIIRTPGSDAVTIYTAGTQLTGGDDNSNQLWKIDYFEYNDDEIPNNVINNDSENKVDRSISQLQAASSNDRVLKTDLQSRSDTSSSKLVFDSIGSNLENGKQLDAPQTDRGAIDVMLVQDQMLKVRPRDQLRQQLILQMLKKRNEGRHLLHSRRHQMAVDNLQKVHFNSLKTIDQNELNQGQQHLQVVAPQTHNSTRGYPNQNFTKALTHSWSDIAVDETSEPLYTDGFLERVQRVKSQLYQHRLFYDRKFKGKVNKLYLLNNSSKCQGLSTVHVVYLINSHPESTDQRQFLRQTVLKSNSFHSFYIVHVFLMGKSSSSELQEKLKLESQLYGDIVQGDFEDTAQKSAWKVLMGMRWVLRFCAQVHFVLKMDENVFVDTDKLVRGLVQASVSVIGKRSMFCALGYISNDNLTVPFCEGFAVVMSRHLVCSIVAASNQIRVPVVEDYYLYGALPFVTGGVEVYNLSGNHGFQKNGDEALSCYRNQKDKCPILATRSETGGFKYLWDMTQTREDKSSRWSNLWDLKSVQSYLS